MIKLNYPAFWQKKGLIATILLPFCYLYVFLGYLRKLFAYPVKINSFVICVGNASVGGTGKTQVVKWLADHLGEQGYSIILVTKSYGAKLRGAKFVEKYDKISEIGDESKMLSAHHKVVAYKSIKKAIKIINQLSPEIVIFDDGMQNPHFHKDFNIMVIDTLRGIGNNYIFPAGPLREKASITIEKSDAIIFVGDEPCNDFTLLKTIKNYSKATFKAKITPSIPVDSTKNYFAFAGIGNPERFFKLIEKNGGKLAKTQIFPDHHYYTKQQITELKNKALEANLELITTSKDFVKLDNDKDISSLEVNLRVTNEKNLLSMIDEKIATHN